MPRAARYAPGGFVYHTLNRAVARLPLFEKDGDYAAFERVFALALGEAPDPRPGLLPDAKSLAHGFVAQAKR